MSRIFASIGRTAGLRRGCHIVTLISGRGRGSCGQMAPTRGIGCPFQGDTSIVSSCRIASISYTLRGDNKVACTRLCRKTRSGFERLVFRLTVPARRELYRRYNQYRLLRRLCQAKNRFLSGRRRSFQTDPSERMIGVECIGLPVATMGPRLRDSQG